MLTVSRLSASHGGIRALRGVALSLAGSGFSAVLGPNGSGKSTLLRAIGGLHRPVRGSITLNGSDVASLPLHRVVRRGIALVPEERMVLAPLTVAEHLSLSGLAGRGRQADLLEQTYALFPELARRAADRAGALPALERLMLAIGRAVMTRPRILLVDEPSRGLQPEQTEVAFAALATLHRGGMAILVAEQNAARALEASSFAYILRRGQIVAQGRPDDLRESPEAVEAYLG